MIEKKLIFIQDSVGFALRSIRAQKDYIEYLVNQEGKEISVTILTYPFLEEVTIETFTRTGAKVTFESLNNKIDNSFILKIQQSYGMRSIDIISESNSVEFLHKKS